MHEGADCWISALYFAAKPARSAAMTGAELAAA
jgi:hypothetical protein